MAIALEAIHKGPCYLGPVRSPPEVVAGKCGFGDTHRWDRTLCVELLLRKEVIIKEPFTGLFIWPVGNERQDTRKRLNFDMLVSVSPDVIIEPIFLVQENFVG